MDETLHYSLTYKDVVALLRAAREGESVSSFSLEIGDLKLSFTRASSTEAGKPDVAVSGLTSAPTDRGSEPVTSVSPSTRHSEASDYAQDGQIAVTAPMLGTFYRSPSPSEPPYVKEGDVVAADQTIGLIEAMKLFTPISAGYAGRVAKVLAMDATLVEYGQPLVFIDPSQV
jgi:acetyl-CoA carboxylase biotin carboxyl carrier protein